MTKAVLSATIAPLVSLDPSQVAVVNVSSAAGGQQTLVSLVSIVPPGRSAAFARMVAALFDGTSPGARAGAVLSAALVARGFPTSVVAVLATGTPPPPIASFVDVAQGQQIALDLPFQEWQLSPASNSVAVQLAVAEVMGIPQGTVWVTSASVAALGGTAVSLDFIAPSTTSSDSAHGQSLPTLVSQFAQLFGNEAVSGNPASPALHAALHRYGVPGRAYYNNQLIL